MAEEPSTSFGAGLVPDWRSFAAGSFSGCVGNIVGFPLDTVRVLLQSSDGAGAARKGIVAHFREIVAAEGLLGLFRGVYAPVLGAMLENSVAFAANEHIKRSAGIPDDVSATPLLLLWASGVGTGFFVPLATSPTELVKTVMQVDRSSGSYAATIARVRAAKGLTHGWTSTTLRETSFYGIYFASYEAAKRLWADATGCESSEQVGALGQVTAGGIAGVAGWGISYPTDIIKTRIQGKGHVKDANTSLIHVTRSLVQKHGWQSLYRGLGATLLRAFPVNGATFLAYEFASKWLQQV